MTLYEKNKKALKKFLKWLKKKDQNEKEEAIFEKFLLSNMQRVNTDKPTYYDMIDNIRVK